MNKCSSDEGKSDSARRPLESIGRKHAFHADPSDLSDNLPSRPRLEAADELSIPRTILDSEPTSLPRRKRY